MPFPLNPIQDEVYVKTDPPNEGMYVFDSGSWVRISDATRFPNSEKFASANKLGEHFLGPVVLAKDPEAPMEAVTKRFMLEAINLATADVTPPIATSYNPTNGSVGIAITTDIDVTFNENVQRGTGNIILRAGATGIETFNAASSPRISISGNVVTINPSSDLSNVVTYSVDFPSGSIKDLAGNDWAGTTSYSFTTVSATDTIAPLATSFSPTNGSSGNSVLTNVEIIFNENVTRGTGNITLMAGATTVETFDAATSLRITITGNTFTLNPTSDLNNSVTYSVNFPAGSIKDLAGNNWAGTTSYSFTTVASGGDVTAPLVSSFSPANSSVDNSVSTNIQVFFNEAIQRGTGNIVLRSGASTVETFNVATSPRISISGSILTIDPTSDLSGNITYNVDFPSGSIKDLANNNWVGTTSYSFTTGISIESGSLWSWGHNSSGQLGLGNTTDRSSPVQIGSLTDWKQIESGLTHSIAIKADGTLWSWGNNLNGQLGLGNTTYRSSPVQVGTLTNWKQVSAGGNLSAAIKTDGTLWAWGLNTNGQLGLGDTTNRSSPIQVGSLTDWKLISCGHAHTLAIKTDGTLWTWGANYSGELGNGNTTNTSSPVQIGSLTNWASVAAAWQHSVALKTDGTLWTWGYNNQGQLGHNDRTSRSSPIQVGSLTDWQQIDVSTMETTLAIKTNGTLWTWGYGFYGQLGSGSIADRSSPVQVGSLTNWKYVTGGHTNSFAIKTDGTLWAWGENDWGQLGQGNTTDTSSPVQIGSLTNWTSVSAGNAHALGIIDSSIDINAPTAVNYEPANDETGVNVLTNIFVTFNENVQRGTGNITLMAGATTVETFNAATSPRLTITGNVLMIDPTSDLTPGTTYTLQFPGGCIKDLAGNNWVGNTTYNFTTLNSEPSTLWAWGRNDQGQLGNGEEGILAHKSSPVQVGSFNDWKEISAGLFHTIGIRHDGTMWAWGYNNIYYTLGLSLVDAFARRSTPVQIGALTTWSKVSAHNYSTLALKTDGTLWGWGDNQVGQLGNNNTINQSSPVQVGADNDWKRVACAGDKSFAIKTDGTLWAWGNNNSGLLGLGDAFHRSSPTQVGSLTDWAEISAASDIMFAIKTDNTLWSWGYNFYGALGHGSTINRSSPTQVGTLASWESISAGNSVLGIRTNGTLWAWGYNLNGELGLGDTTHRSSPVQVGALTNWSHVSTGDFSLGVRTNGTMWAWGSNSIGQLGQGNTTHRSSPVQVGSLNGWKLVEASTSSSAFAIRNDTEAPTVVTFNPTNGATGVNPNTNITITFSEPIQRGIGNIMLRAGVITVETFDAASSPRLTISGNILTIDPTAALDYETVYNVDIPSGAFKDISNNNYAGTTAYSFTTALLGHTLWAWGWNDYYVLANGSSTPTSTPIQVGALTTWNRVSSSGSSVLAITTNGTLWSWGRNDYGQLAQSNIFLIFGMPTQVGTLSDWKEVSSADHSLAVKTDGTLWAWGKDDDGQLGIGYATTSVSSPIQVGSLTNWRYINAAYTNSAAIKTDGTLWTWGSNLYGQLGIGNMNYMSSPVQVGLMTDWKQVSVSSEAMLAIKTDGTLWSWGYHGFGVLGRIGASSNSSPIQVGALDTWKQISAGGMSVVAVTTDGKLYTWGSNDQGELGLGDSGVGTQRPTPTQVGTLTNWNQVGHAHQSVYAIKTDGTLWSWGYNIYGGLGNGNTINVSSPVQIGSLTNWASIEGGSMNGFAFKT